MMFVIDVIACIYIKMRPATYLQDKNKTESEKQQRQTTFSSGKWQKAFIDVDLKNINLSFL